MLDLLKPWRRWQPAVLALALPLLGSTASAQSLKNGLKAYWDFEGNFDDKAPSGVYDGTGNGGNPIAFVSGKAGFGKAIELDGVDQYVEITGGEPDDLAFEAGSMTVSAWFKVGAFDKSWQALVVKGENTSWRIHRRDATGGFAHAGGTGEGPEGTPVDDGNWHHVAAVTDANATEFGTRIYVDGEVYSENTSTPTLAVNGKPLMIGENPDARGRYWNGQIDDVALWDRVLTQDEVKSIFANGAGKSISVLLGAVVVDTDKDGMPDDYENEKGFNPNDASDAAKDFDGDGVSNLDEYKAGTDPIDVTKPTITAAASSPSFNTITLTFSEELEATSAGAAANYTITPALAVSSVSYAKKVVTLTTAAQTPGGTAYTVAVKGVKDTSKNEVAAGTQATVFSYLLTKAGALQIKVWENISGTPVQNLFDDPRYPASPDRTGAIYSFNSRDFLPTDALENYGAVIEGYVTPAESGNYRFFIYSDDASLLQLSTDDKPANLVQIAEETGCCNAFTEPDSPRTSEPIALVAGKKYFIQMVYKEGGGGDYGQTAWRKEGDKTPAGALTPIPGKFLSSAVDLPFPAEGVFVSRTPGPGATAVSPASKITIVHNDGKTPWTDQNVTLKLDGAAVSPTITKDGSTVTIVFDPPGLLASESTHTVTLGYADPSGAPASTEWSFAVAKYAGPVKDKLHGYEGLILGISAQDADKSGFDGKAGNKAINNGTKNSGNSVLIYDATWLNAATAADKLTASFWQKRTDVTDSSMVWMDSVGSSSGNRGFQAHTPWSNNNVYFDTAGCCDGTTQRISNDVTTFPSWSGDNSWWYTWRHFAFVKDGGHKSIYIDGELFFEGDNSGVLPTDFERIWLGAEGGGTAGKGNNFHGSFDDFAVFGSALTAAQVKTLSGGGVPTSLPAGANLLAYWDFNDDLSSVPSTGPKLVVARSGNNVTVTSDPQPLAAGFVLQTATAVNGPWTTVAGQNTPFTAPIGSGAIFLRAVKP